MHVETYTREAIKLGSWFPSGPLFVSFQRPEKSRSDRNLLNRLKSELFSSPLPRAPFSASSFVVSLPCTFSVLFSDHPSFLRHSLSLSLFLFPSASPSGPSFSSRTRDFKFVGGCRKIHRESRLTSPGDQRNVKSVRTKFHRRFVSLGTGFKAREISVDKVKKFVLYTVKYAASIGRYVANFTFLLVVRSSWKNVCSV